MIGHPVTAGLLAALLVAAPMLLAYPFGDYDELSAAAVAEMGYVLESKLPGHEQLACHAGGQGRIEVRWLEPGRAFAVSATRDLAPGPSRYNCTAPSGAPGRYYWYSHPWIVRDGGS